MIADCLTFVRAHLNERMRAYGSEPDDATADKVVFLDGDKLEPIAFKQGAVTQLLINVEEERVLRSADLYARPAEQGPAQRVQPELRLILYVLFVARFKRYEQAWDQLSKILQLFQGQRVFDRSSAPTLPAGIEKLVLELVTLSMAEQNELWSMFRTSQHPALLYRVHMLALRDLQAEAEPMLRPPIRIDVTPRATGDHGASNKHLTPTGTP